MLAVVHRAVVLSRLTEMIRLAGEARQGVGVLIVRLSNLRQVMLGLSYAAGDALLEATCARVASAVRRRDWLARIGDEDFALLLPGVLSTGQLLLGAHKLSRTAGEPLRIDGGVVPLRFTIGGAFSLEYGADAERLLHAAEKAAAHAEKSMTPMLIVGPEQLEGDTTELQVEALLDRAFERSEFELYYQAKVELASGRLIGAEALSRWTSRELGPISPDVFVPIAERSGHIERLTWSAINSALQLNAEWRALGRELTVAVNVSALCLRSEDLSERLRGALELWNVPAPALTLEITESTAMQDAACSFAILRAVRELGVHVSIDDFGTGYSSLAHFRTLPADELKIDKSFVRNLTTIAADRHLVQSLIDLAHRFDLTVVAEGVEDAATAEVLRKMGCDLGQGYYFARPLPPQEFAASALASDLVPRAPVSTTPDRRTRSASQDEAPSLSPE